MAQPHIVIASHHKVGTVWMMTTFMRLAKANGWAYIHLNEGESGWGIRPDKQAFFEARRAEYECAHPGQAAIFHDYHSAIPDLTEAKQSPGVRGLHIIRDPRDMLLSAVRFHLKANEPWLDEPDPQWGGRSFREKLASYTTLEDRVRFEMDTHMGWTVERMAGFDGQGVFKNIRYEDLIVDHDMKRFHEALVYLGLVGRQLTNGLDAFWASSLFGERSEHDRRATAGHVFDSSPMQWVGAMPESCVDAVESRFGEAIVKLGYPLRSMLKAGGDRGPAGPGSTTIGV